jgi:hypothetical protein
VRFSGLVVEQRLATVQVRFGHRLPGGCGPPLIPGDQLTEIVDASGTGRGFQQIRQEQAEEVRHRQWARRPVREPVEGLLGAPQG